MLTFIEGNLVEVTPAYTVVENNGIGFLVNTSLRTFSAIKNMQRCKLFTHLAIRSEATTPVGFVIYGFIDETERHLFLQLISVSGIGANTARLILSSLSLEDIYFAIASGNAETFQKVKGIGEKSSQRIIIDLKGKIDKQGYEKDKLIIPQNNIKKEALAALVMLGFTRNACEKVIDKIFNEENINLTVEELIKKALKFL